MGRVIDTDTKKKLKVILEAIDDKKGNNIVSIDLSNIETAVTDYFVITNADSTTQVSAIAHEIEKATSKKLKEKVWKSEGYENLQWVLLDYGSIVVHVFQTPYREFYKLEELWADAKIKKHIFN
jgi:ribosome-associated protein